MYIWWMCASGLSAFVGLVYTAQVHSQRDNECLLLSPDVNDKVSCGFAWFWYAFQTGKLHNRGANLQLRFFFFSSYIIIIILSCFGGKTECQATDKFVFLVMISANLRSVLFCSCDSLT